MSCLLWLLVLCCVFRGQDFHRGIVDSILNETQAQHDRIQSIFELIQNKKIQCTAPSGQQGTCISRKECSKLNGVASGNCAWNWGACCVIQRACDSFTKSSATYFSNPNHPGTYKEPAVCSITVSKANTNVCQLRVDYLDFVLHQPDPDGNCIEDVLQITGGSYVPPICGLNSGQHVYVDFQSHTTPIMLSVLTGSVHFNRKWTIKITQIECGSPQRAPENFLMYFTEVRGKVKSFNYDPAPGVGPATRQLANMNYVVGVKQAPGSCGIEWNQDPDDIYSFTVTGDTNAFSDLLGDPTLAEEGNSCTSDFVIIPNSLRGKDRFCGSSFGETTKTYTKPFTLTVVTDDKEVPTDFANRGFSLLYRQIPCL